MTLFLLRMVYEASRRVCPFLYETCCVVHVSYVFLVLKALPQIIRSAPFPPVSRLGARSSRGPVSLPISTTEEHM
jgi:hypothetical protein